MNLKFENPDLKTRSRPENEKPGNEKLNSMFTLKSPLSHYRTTSEFGEPCEGGDRVSALPENLNKPSEKVSKRTGR